MDEAAVPADRQQGGKSSRGKGKYKPKGRMVDQTALADIKSLLGDTPPRRDMLIEALHLVQDHYKCLSARHLAALADLMRLPMAEIWEVASFYDHFDLVREGEDAPAPCSVRVCTSLSCMMAGGETLLERLQPYAFRWPKSGKLQAFMIILIWCAKVKMRQRRAACVCVHRCPA